MTRTDINGIECPYPTAACPLRGWCGAAPHDVVVRMTAQEPEAWARMRAARNAVRCAHALRAMVMRYVSCVCPQESSPTPIGGRAGVAVVAGEHLEEIATVRLDRRLVTHE